MKLLYTALITIVTSIFSLFVCYIFYSIIIDIQELKADYSMLYSEIEQLKSRIESMELE